ncbi:MAG: TIM barrel protein [Acidobacteriota bacterium]|nr:TIM barrel protein [Acidobacteriota bacterium]
MPILSRRDALKVGAAATVGAVSLPGLDLAANSTEKIVKKGRIKQSACFWCYEKKVPLDDLCKNAAEMGMAAIDLLNAGQWETARKHGLTCSVGYAEAGNIADGLNNKANHDKIIQGFEKNIPLAKKAGVPNVIVFFGNRRGMSDDEAIANSVACLNRAKKIAEDNGVNIVIELLNSKVDHKDYIGDRTSYGVEVCKAVGSERVKLLYDIYHMQIMEGDVIRTIKNNHQYIGHYHTGGNPGRNEIDQTQELHYPAIVKAIIDTGFAGFMAHEFIPKRDPLTSLREAVALCDV